MDYNEITNRIDELNLDGYKHIKNNDWGYPGQLTKWLKNKNFKLLGDGAYSTVFQSPTENFVVKVNDGLLGYDENYTCFAEYCYKNKNNQHLPKIGKIKEYQGWFIIFIEKLNNKFKSSDLGFSNDHDMKLFFKIIGKNTGNIFNSNDKGKQIIINILDEMKGDTDDLMSGKEIFEGMKNNDQLLDICYTLVDFLAEYNIDPSNVDLHAGNFMMRGDTIVITDPVM